MIAAAISSVFVPVGFLTQPLTGLMEVTRSIADIQITDSHIVVIDYPNLMLCTSAVSKCLLGGISIINMHMYR
jgi:hypothetical protein